MKPSFHPLAELFPLMEGAEFDALAADIKAHGLREPIVLLDDQILDGRNRYRACEAANVEPIYQEWDNGGDPTAFVVSKNLHRRHLSESQRALVAAQLYSTKVGENQHTIQVAGIPVTTRGEAAKLLNVHHTTVTDAKKVLTDGTTEEIEAVKRGEAAVSTIADQIRAKAPPEKRAKKRIEPMSQAGKNPERIQNQQINAEIWGRIRESLTHLTSLPLPAEAAAIARTNDRTGLVDARLSKATQWLKEFSDAWHGQ
jgi:hypothetical protein